MNTQKRVRPERIAAAKSKQSQTPGMDHQSDPMAVQRGITEALNEIDNQVGEAQSERDEIFLLTIRQYLSPLADVGPCITQAQEESAQAGLVSVVFPSAVAPLIDQAAKHARLTVPSWICEAVREKIDRGGAAEVAGRAAQEKSAPARSDYMPFGPLEPTGAVQSARMHIQTTYEGCLGRQWDDAASILLDLTFCLEGNHALSVEREALKAIADGVSVINEYLKVRMGKLTGAESWLDRKLKGGDIQMEAAWNVLFEARSLIADNPASAELLHRIEAMFDGKIIMNNIANWLELL